MPRLSLTIDAIKILNFDYFFCSDEDGQSMLAQLS